MSSKQRLNFLYKKALQKSVDAFPFLHFSYPISQPLKRQPAAGRGMIILCARAFCLAAKRTDKNNNYKNKRQQTKEKV